MGTLHGLKNMFSPEIVTIGGRDCGLDILSAHAQQREAKACSRMWLPFGTSARRLLIGRERIERKRRGVRSLFARLCGQAC